MLLFRLCVTIKIVIHSSRSYLISKDLCNAPCRHMTFFHISVVHPKDAQRMKTHKKLLIKNRRLKNLIIGPVSLSIYPALPYGSICQLG